MDGYTYKGKTPLGYAEEFTDNLLSHHTLNELQPYWEERGVPTYGCGLFMVGVDRMYAQNKNDKYNKLVTDWVEKVTDDNKRLNRGIHDDGTEDGWASMHTLDFRQAGRLLFRQYEETNDKRYLDSIGELCDTLFTDYPKTKNGILWHMDQEDIQYQVWVDGLYMVAPMCAMYTKATGNDKYGKMAVNQAILMYEKLHDEKDGLLFHGWDESGKAVWADPVTGQSPEKWGRALGWFVVASNELIEILGNDFEGIDRVKANQKRVLASLMKLQRATDGYWMQIIDKPDAEGNWRESSCTCLIAQAFSKAYRLGLVGEEYLAAARKAFEGVVDSLYADDYGCITLDEVCCGTGVDDGDYDYYINRKKIKNDLHGSGAFLQMCTELNLSR